LLLFAIISILAGAILSSIVGGGMTEYAVRRFRGESITLERALRRGLDRLLSILGASLLLTLLLFALVFVPFLLILLPFTGGTVNPAAAIGAICGGFVLLAVGGLIALYVGIATSLYAPAIMMENATATSGLMRSWRLTKRHWWSLFGAILAAGILGGVITLVVTIPISLLRRRGRVDSLQRGASLSRPLPWFRRTTSEARAPVTSPSPRPGTHRDRHERRQGLEHHGSSPGRILEEPTRGGVDWHHDRRGHRLVPARGNRLCETALRAPRNRASGARIPR